MRLILWSERPTDAAMVQALAGAGFAIEIRPSAQTIVAACASDPPPVAILGWVASSAQGVRFLKECQSALGSGCPPIVLILPRGTDRSADSLLNAGASAAPVAPVDPGLLVQILFENSGASAAAAPYRVAALAEPAPTPPYATPVVPAPTPPYAMPVRTPRATPVVAGPIPSHPTVVPAPTPPRATPLPAAIPRPATPPAGPTRTPSTPVSMPGPTPPPSRPGRRTTAEEPVTELELPRAQFDATSARRWPELLPSIDECIALLKMRAVGRAPSGNIDAKAVAQTWRSLTNPEVHAIWSVAEAPPESPPTSADLALLQVAAARLRAQAALVQADAVVAATRQIEVDRALVAAVGQELMSTAKEGLDNLIQWAVAHGDPAQVQELRDIREDLALARSELDAAAARVQDPPDRRARQTAGRRKPDEDEPEDRHADHAPSAFSGFSTAAAQWLSEHGPNWLRAGAALAVAAATFELVAHEAQVSNTPADAGVDAGVVVAAEPPAVDAGPPAVAPLPPVPPALPPVASRRVSPREQECAQLAGPRRSLEMNVVSVFGTIVSGQNSTAVMADKSREQAVRLGDFIGSHCWRVSDIAEDFVSVVQEMEPGKPGKSLKLPVKQR